MKSIEAFLRQQYSDHKLIELLEAAENGELRAMDPSRCLLGRSDAGYLGHRTLFRSNPAEREFLDLWPTPFPTPRRIAEAQRILNERMLPLIRAEVSRRANVGTNLQTFLEAEYARQS